MMELIVPTIRDGGCDIVYVMVCISPETLALSKTSLPMLFSQVKSLTLHKPNLQPPITTIAAALSYRKRLQALAPNVTFLMTLYLHSSITPAHIAEAAAAGIVGVKAYPMGLTTHSEAGVVDYEAYYPVLEAMQEHDLVLNLHREAPSTPSTAFMSQNGGDAITVLNAEVAFLPTLHKIHAAFPKKKS
jgi:dihydroorotase